MKSQVLLKVKNLKGKWGATYVLLYFIVYFYRDSEQLKVIAVIELAGS